MNIEEAAGPARPSLRRILWCMACGQSRESTAEELSRSAGREWPRCCGGIMSYLAELPAEATVPPGDAGR